MILSLFPQSEQIWRLPYSYYKFIQCMLLNLPQPANQEDLAISCLLEVDQKQHLDQADWTFKNPSKKSKGSVTTYLDFKANRSRNFFNRNKQKQRSKDKYNPQMLEMSEDGNSQQRNHGQKDLKNCQHSRSWLQNQGAYWCSKVNWTSTGFKEEQRSQRKISKKFFFGYEANSPQGSRRSRYDTYQKTRDEQYKVDLIHKMLRGEAERLKQQQIKIKSMSMPKADSVIQLCHKHHRESFDLVQRQGQCNSSSKKDDLLGYIRQSMRDTMKRIWAKNISCNQLGCYTSPKSIEGSKGALVRELLMNLQKKKEQPQNSDKNPKKGSRYLVKKQDAKKDNRIERIKLDRLKEIDMLADEQSMKLNKIINLNLEAERVYNTRSVNRRRQIKPTP